MYEEAKSSKVTLHNALSERSVVDGILFAGGIIGVAIGGATRGIPDIKDSVNVHIIAGAFITYPKPSSSKVDAVCQTVAILSSRQTLARCTRTSPVFTLGVP
jgi:hypothetical protein